MNLTLYFLFQVSGVNIIFDDHFQSDHIISLLFSMTLDIRIKRSQADYMRWRDDLEPAPEEFIVKVLDDDVTTTETTPIVAINVLQDKKSQEKIIVDGAIVPSKTQKIQENEIAKVYTRFIAPTTNIAQIKEEFLTPVTHININNDNLDPEPRGKICLT